MKDKTIITIVGVIIGISVILGIAFTFLIDSNAQTDSGTLFGEEYYEIEITGLKDSYLAGEPYSFSYVLSGFGNSCGSRDVSFPTNESDENVSMMSRGLCTDATPKKFVLDVQTEKGTTFGHVKLDPGDYFVTVEFEKTAIFASETKRFTVNSLNHSQDTEHESEYPLEVDNALRSISTTYNFNEFIMNSNPVGTNVSHVMPSRSFYHILQ